MSPIENITNINFEENLKDSRYIKPVRMNFTRQNSSRFWDMCLQMESVAVLLYHTRREQFVLVKQFRPAVYAQKVCQMEENTKKEINGIEWDKYPMSIGDTLELCAGMLDKEGKSALETVKEEIMEECGYEVDPNNIVLIKKYWPDVGAAAAIEYLYYCEVDDSMKLGEGGGVHAEGESIEIVID